MNKFNALLVGTAVGAAAMYLLDPERGRRRRALIRDQLVHSGHKLQDAAGATAADVRNRAQGYRTTLRSSLSRNPPPADDVLGERVRAAIGRVCTHPGAIEVAATGGVVTLSGPVLAREVPLLIDRVFDVRGTRNVVNRLEPHADADKIPGLQGEGRPRAGERPEFFQHNWSPAARLVAGAAGAAAALYGLSSRGMASKAAGVAGLLLLGRAVTNLELKQLTGVGAGPRAVSVQKTIHINAPVERVFELWAKCENYPNFMTHVQECRPLEGDGETRRWHWRVRGRSGIEFEFDTTMTAYEENRFIAWRTDPGALIQHAGQGRFIPNPDGTTMVDVTLSYNPVAGAVGHVIAKLLGDDPKHQLDDDLMRMKSFIETGVPPRDAAARAERPTA